MTVMFKGTPRRNTEHHWPSDRVSIKINNDFVFQLNFFETTSTIEEAPFPFRRL